MKKFILVLVTLFTVSVFTPAFAQQTSKDIEKKLKQRSMKKARKEAKMYKKDGYYVAIGALPMDIQLESAWFKQMETDEQGYPKYIVATGNSVSKTQTAAKIQATETAKLELAGTIATNVAALIENNIATQQLSTTEAAAVTKTVAASKNVIAQELGRVIPLVEMYKKIGEDNIEANVRLAYDSKTATDIAKKAIRQKLEEDTDILQDKLDKLMNF